MSSSTPQPHDLNAILISQDPENQPNPNPNHQQLDQETLEDLMTLSPKTLTLQLPHPPDFTQIEDDPDPINLFSPSTTISRRGAGAGRAPKRRKMAKKRSLYVKKTQKKLEGLLSTLKPIPFVPNKFLDFSAHEPLLKRLGLWDFVHVKFDSDLRTDLIAQLIASYNQSNRCSYVNDVKIMVNRADLARALKLPVKKDRSNALVENSVMEPKETADSVGFIDEFVSNWLLLHDDLWMMPAEVLNWNKAIKEGNFERVDWAGLVWFMMEKELSTASLEDCYYASHLQCLIKSQKEDLLAVKMEVDGNEDEEEDVRMEDEFPGGSSAEIEERNIELSLGGLEGTGKEIEVDNSMKEVKEDVGVAEEEAKEEVDLDDNEVKEDVDLDSKESKKDVNLESKESKKDVDLDEMEPNLGVGEDDGVAAVHCDFGENVEEEKGEQQEEGLWLKSGTDFSFLRSCTSVGEGISMECEGDSKQEEEEEEEEDDMDFNLLPNRLDMNYNSENLIPAMEAQQHLSFSSGLQIPDDFSSGDFLASGVDPQMIAGGSSRFSNIRVCKREVGHLESEGPRHSLNVANKRMRNNDPTNMESLDLGDYMVQMQQLAEKAKMVHAAKEQDFQQLTMNYQILQESFQQQQANMIELQRIREEELQKRKVEIYRYENELYMLGNLLEGYRKGLKETRKAFAEYRAKCPVPLEPIYKDSGHGGLVLSVRELEKQRLRQEEEEMVVRLLNEKKIADFEAEWVAKFEEHSKLVELLDSKLLKVEKEFKVLKEMRAKHELMEPSAEPSAPSAEPMEPSAEPMEPSAEPSAPSAEPSAPSAEPREPSAGPREPSAEPREPSAEPREPSAGPMEPSAEPKEPSVEPTELAAQAVPVEPSDCAPTEE